MTETEDFFWGYFAVYRGYSKSKLYQTKTEENVS